MALVQIRIKHTIWVPDDTDQVLQEVEREIWQMAANAHYTEVTYSGGVGWSTAYEKAHLGFCRLSGLKYSPLDKNVDLKVDDPETNVRTLVIAHVREILGVSAYAEVRNLAIRRARSAGAALR